MLVFVLIIAIYCQCVKLLCYSESTILHASYTKTNIYWISNSLTNKICKSRNYEQNKEHDINDFIALMASSFTFKSIIII